MSAVQVVTPSGDKDKAQRRQTDRMSKGDQCSGERRKEDMGTGWGLRNVGWGLFYKELLAQTAGRGLCPPSYPGQL